MKKIYANTLLTPTQAQQLLKQYGSPLYLYDAQVIRHKAKLLTQAAQNFHISYAMKANNNSHILRLLQQCGVPNVDVVSPGQIYKALSCGYKPEQILYTENFICEEELDYALKEGVVLNIGALQTLKRFKDKLRHKQIFVRFNPDLGAGQTYQVITGGPKSKFGIYHTDIDELIALAKQNQIHIIGLHQHIGSNLKAKDQEVFINTVKYIFQLSLKFTELKYINIGGGVGIQYRPEEQVIDIERLYGRVREVSEENHVKTGRKIDIWIEPGRFLVGDCGILLCRFTARKQTPERIFYGTDTGFNHLIRPALYGSHHQIYNLTNPNHPQQIVTICGNICQCSDNIGTQIKIGGQIGDVFCIQNAGAYGYAMSMNYNERVKPAQVMKDGDKFTVVRRRETFEDLAEKV